jgi:histidinol-phosphate/aromatic aminotransferase/cobyric acid decarboxylase-like protein
MSSLPSIPLRPPAPGSHGGDVLRIARALGCDPDTLLDLSASLNPAAPDVPALALGHLDSLRRYPDATDARRSLAEAIDVAPEELLLTNGGAEGIALLAQALGGQVSEPEFSLHPRGDGAAPRWRSNPHNPTGRLAGPDERAEVWDEAFYPLATGRWTRGDNHAIAVVGSLTKLYECPGLRLGYVIADPGLIAELAENQAHWSVGSLAVALVPELLALTDLAHWSDQIRRLRGDLCALLERHGLVPQPSQANFVLCRCPAGLRDDLLLQGVMVRDCTSFGLPDHLRIGVPDDEGLSRLDAALDACCP